MRHVAALSSALSWNWLSKVEKKTYRFSRSELHELVWSRPISELAPTLGLSDQGLAKTCARHLIPKPSRGYWTKLAAGMKPKITPLRPVKHSPLENVVIFSVTDEVADTVLARYRRHAARAVREAEKSELFRPAERERRKTAASYVYYDNDAAADEPNTTMAGVSASLRSADADKYGEISSYQKDGGGVFIHMSSLARSLTFLNKLTNALADRGISITAKEREFAIAKEGADLTFNFYEIRKRVLHDPTSEELARQKLIDDENKRNNDFDLSGMWNRVWDKFDYKFTGQLCVNVNIRSCKIRKSWTDGKQQTIEKALAKIVDGIELLLDYEREREVRAKEREDGLQQRRKRYLLAKAFREREIKREEFLQALVVKSDEIRVLQKYLKSAEPESGFGHAKRMIAWIERRLGALNEEISPLSIDRRLEELSLFPEVDDLHDPLGILPEDQYPWF